ncbi:MAG: glycosyltransferase family 4 protein [Methanomassiliicoccales archaeon]|nr:MAG: glycosyltransferase family 4 protein [Methanomassiliicoccales archaeon]
MSVWALRVLHIENPAGVASELRDAQRRSGVDSDVLVTWPNPMKFPVDHEVPLKGMTLTSLKGMKEVIRISSGYDVLHVHTGINWKRADLVWLGAIRKRPILLHYHGSETRLGYGAYYSSLGDAKVVATPDLLDWWEDAEYVPNPVKDELFNVPFSPPSGTIKILHMPTDRTIKGTDKVLEAISLLKKDGLAIEFTVLEHVPHDEAISAIRRSDIVIDWISDRSVTGIAGIYGKTSIEAMALGKVAVAFIDDEMRQRYPKDIGVVSPAEPTALSLAECLKGLITDADRLTTVMRKGREYALREHNQNKIVQTFERIYSAIA